jgi:cyanophycinase
MIAVKTKEESEGKSSLSQTQGQLIIIGGAEDKQGECTILREFVRCAGGREAKIAVMTVATSAPDEVGADYKEIFQRLGVNSVEIVYTERPEDASDPRYIEAIKEATGVFFTGGDQARITKLLKDTQIDRLLHTRFSQGLVIAGTSAGAAMMPDIMIVEGEAQTNPRLETVTLEPGMGFLTGIAIDQHFAQRGRLGRLISALIQQPAVLGIGIDENTAIAVRGNEIEVIGEGAVTIVDVAKITHTNIDETLYDESLAICGAKLHILPHGYRFNLRKRECIC